jgi:IclR family acetate operon transcriptional repressor
VHASTANVFQVLRLVSGAEEPLGVTEIARRLRVPVSTVHRALTTLEHAGYLTRSAAAKFEVGARTERLVSGGFKRFAMREASLPYLQQLATASGETTTLCVRLGWYALRLVAVAGVANALPLRPRLGQPVLLHIDAGCRALTAGFDAGERADYLAFVRSRRPDRLAEARAACAGPESPQRPALPPKDARGWVVTAQAGDAFQSLSFALRDGAGAAMAAVAVEGAGLLREGAGLSRGGAGDAGRFAEWAHIVMRLERFLASQPELFRHPYAHIPANDIVFC